LTIERWLEQAVADLRARGLEEAVPVVEAFARSMKVLRAGDWNHSAATAESPSSQSDRA
jgi:hypothetical protein